MLSLSGSLAVMMLHLLLVGPASSWVAPCSIVFRTERTPSSSLWAQGKGKFSQDKQDIMLNFINEPLEGLDAVGDPPTCEPEQDEVADLVRVVVKAADGRKADDICAMRISKISTMATFLVFVSGNSRPQNQAIASAIQDDVEEAYDGLRTQGSGVPEGTAESGWMLLDYGSVMVHIMTPKSRLFYDVEGQWRDKGGEYMDLSDVLMRNNVQEEEEAAQLGGGMAGVAEDDDPFWS